MCPEKVRMTSVLSSVEPSSTTITSFSGHVWASALSMACATHGFALKQGMRIETSILECPGKRLNGRKTCGQCLLVSNPIGELQCLYQLDDMRSKQRRESARSFLAIRLGHFRGTAQKIHRFAWSNQSAARFSNQRYAPLKQHIPSRP